MQPVRSLTSVFAVVVTATIAALLISPAVLAASNTARKPVILGTQSGIDDGQSGTVLQTAPPSHQPIVEAQPIVTPTELAPNSSTPIIVAPYIQFPAGGGTTQQPQPRPQPRPVFRPQ